MEINLKALAFSLFLAFVFFKFLWKECTVGFLEYSWENIILTILEFHYLGLATETGSNNPAFWVTMEDESDPGQCMYENIP